MQLPCPECQGRGFVRPVDGSLTEYTCASCRGTGVRGSGTVPGPASPHGFRVRAQSTLIVAAVAVVAVVIGTVVLAMVLGDPDDRGPQSATFASADEVLNGEWVGRTDCADSAVGLRLRFDEPPGPGMLRAALTYYDGVVADDVAVGRSVVEGSVDGPLVELRHTGWEEEPEGGDAFDITGEVLSSADFETVAPPGCSEIRWYRIQ